MRCPLAKFKTQVDQIEDLWNDLIPTDDSFNLADCSMPAMDCSIPTGKTPKYEKLLGPDF